MVRKKTNILGSYEIFISIFLFSSSVFSPFPFSPFFPHILFSLFLLLPFPLNNDELEVNIKPNVFS